MHNLGIICDKPTIYGGSVSPSDATVSYSETYEITCDTGLQILNGASIITCGADENFDQIPICGKCNQLKFIRLKIKELMLQYYIILSDVILHFINSKFTQNIYNNVVVPIDRRQVVQACTLPFVHGDPAGRFAHGPFPKFQP